MQTIVKINPDRSTSIISEEVPDDVTGIVYSPKEQAVAWFNASTGEVGFVNDNGEARVVPRRLEVPHPIAMSCDQWGIVALQASSEMLWSFNQSLTTSERVCGKRAYEETKNVFPADPLLAAPCAVCRMDRTDVVFAASWAHKIVEIPDGIRRDYAGSGRKGFMSSSNPQMAMLNSPSGVCFDSATRRLFVADTGNSIVRAFLDHKEVACVGRPGQAGHIDGKGASALLDSPSAICAVEGVVFVADGNMVVQIEATTMSALTVYTSSRKIISLAAGVGSLYAMEAR